MAKYEISLPPSVTSIGCKTFKEYTSLTFAKAPKNGCFFAFCTAPLIFIPLPLALKKV